MHSLLRLRLLLMFCALAVPTFAQVAPSKQFVPPGQEEKPATPPPAQAPQVPVQAPRPGAPAPAPGAPAAAPAQTPATVSTPGQQLPPSDAPRLAEPGSFVLPNAPLTEIIDILARRLKINYILDPGVSRGSVSVFTYGEVKQVDYMQLLETLLRVNGAAIVRVGDWYRIVPVAKVSNLPLAPQVNPDQKNIPEDERMTLNLIFLKFATANEMLNLLKPFFGEYAAASVYEPANLLIIQDNARSMRRTMGLISLFDGDQFAGQRVRLFEMSNARPSDMQRELDQIFKAYALSDKSQSVKFIPVDRINVLIAVAPNPGIFAKVQEWIDKLDVIVKTSAGSVNSYVYRLRYGRAETIAMAIMALYSGDPYALIALGNMAQMQSANMVGSSGLGFSGVPGMGYGGGGMGMGGGMYPGMGMGGGMYGGGMGGGMYPGMGMGGGGGYAPGYGGAFNPATSGSALTANAAAQPTPDTTGQYLGQGGGGYGNRGQGPRIPHVIPNPFDNTILIQATTSEYEQILNLLRQLDVPPRQVLIEARIYEVGLTGAFAAGVTAFLEKRDAQGAGSRMLNIATGAGGVALSTGAMVWKSHELLAAITAQETNTHTRVIASPSIIATDSIPASLNVGSDVPVLTSQAVAGGVQNNGSSVFANTISNRSTGVTLQITARVNSSGIVTLIINQNVSAPQPPSSGGIQSPSFSNRSFQTQLTVQDGDTVAIGGIISESDLRSNGGVPFLNRLPVVGPAFGNKSVSKERTELVVFLTPRVIFDAAQMSDAADEIKSGMRNIQKLSRDR
ncbi:MAG TPA: type II secretion system secretin GspD [Candidatus Acidoferrum sp.]|nr:type II secretion system secretin GspD [Candidatus Acidoferrum sp.]